MVYLLFHSPKWYCSYLKKELGDDCEVLFSKNHKQRVVRYLFGSIMAVRKSSHDDTIVCWYDAQAVLCWWICRVLFLKRKIVCLNILLKQKPTLKNRMASFLFKKALTATNFKASVTSRYYGEWLNEKLGIHVDYTLLHDVYHDFYEMPYHESRHDIVFCGGCFGRDWPLMMEIVKAMPDIKFYLIMTQKMEQYHFAKMNGVYPDNVKVLKDIQYQQFMYCLCQSKIVCMPLDCEAPQGLIVMFESAANNKLILTSDTPTTREYFDDTQRLGKDVESWCKCIRYYLSHEDERRKKAMDFHHWLKENCNEHYFATTVRQMVESFED